MSRAKAIILAAFTAWPFVYMLFFFGMIATMVLNFPPEEQTPGRPPFLFLIIFPLHLLTMIVIIALLVTYIVHLFNNDRVPKDQKALWAIVLFLGNTIAMPIYWYLFIWNNPQKSLPEHDAKDDATDPAP